MSEQEQQMLARELANVDRRRAELEMVLGSVSPNCVDYRDQLEGELSGLWRLRLELAKQLHPRRTLLRA